MFVTEQHRPNEGEYEFVWRTVLYTKSWFTLPVTIQMQGTAPHLSPGRIIANQNGGRVNIHGNGVVDRTLVGSFRRRSVIPHDLAFHPHVERSFAPFRLMHLATYLS